MNTDILSCQVCEGKLIHQNNIMFCEKCNTQRALIKNEIILMDQEHNKSKLFAEIANCKMSQLYEGYNYDKFREDIENEFEEERISDWEYFTIYPNNAEILERDKSIWKDIQIIDEVIEEIKEKEHREIQRILKKLLF